MREKITADKFMQTEDNIFEMGTKNSTFCVFMILGTMYGYESPFILLALIKKGLES